MVSAERIKTNHMLIDDLDMWGEFRINKSRDSTGTQKYYNIISEIIDQQLNAGKQWLNSTEAKDYFFEEAKYQQGIFQSLEDEWETILQNNYHHIDDLIEEVYNQGKLKGYNDIRRRLVFTDTDREALKFVRHYNFQLIRNLSNDLRANVKKTITKRIATGENPYNVANELLELGVTRLPGSTFTPKQRAVMIAKTEVSRAQNTGILQSYVNEGYTEVKILTAEDGHVCRLCLENAYEFNSDEIIYDNRGKDRVHRIRDMNSSSWVPLHPNCRCTYTAVWESRRDNLKPEVINLTPLEFGSLKDLADRYAPLKWKKLNKKDIPGSIPPTISKAILKFEEEYNNVADGNEWGLVYNKTKNKFEEIYSDKKVDGVNPLINDYGNDELYIMHNHNTGTFLSPKDFGMGFYREENIKGVVTHIEDKIFVATFEDKPNSLEYFNEFLKKYNEFVGKYGYNERTWLKFNSDKILNKYIDYEVVIK